MPAPQDSVLLNTWKGVYPGKLTPDTSEYAEKLFKEVSSGWGKWQSGIKFGNFIVQGGGIGAWAGVGNGPGIATAAPFVLTVFPFAKNTPEHVKFIQSLAQVLTIKFAEFISGFALPVASYVGTSGASPISPGPVAASIMPVPVATLATPPVKGIATQWKALLTPPDFNLAAPEGKGSDMIDSVSDTIEKIFATSWSASSMLSGSSLITAGAPGGVAAGTSQMDGTFV